MNPDFKVESRTNWEDQIESMEFGIITDAKSVFDALSRPSTVSASEKRTCIDLSIVREFLRVTMAVLDGLWTIPASRFTHKTDAV